MTPQEAKAQIPISVVDGFSMMPTTLWLEIVRVRTSGLLRLDALSDPGVGHETRAHSAWKASKMNNAAVYGERMEQDL